MSPLTETVLFVFGLVALGYLAGWTGYLKPEKGEGISEFAVGVARPPERPPTIRAPRRPDADRPGRRRLWIGRSRPDAARIRLWLARV